MTLRINIFSITVAMVFSLATSLVACHRYAPPVRIANHGAPAKLHAKEMELGGSYSQLIIDEKPAFHGGGGFAVNDHLVLEAGVDGQIKAFTIVNGGIRFIPKPTSTQYTQVKFLFDVEFGGGLGVGGDSCKKDGSGDEGFGPDWQQTDDIPWNKRFAGGAYVGSGIGFNISWFDLFTRTGYQITRAKNVPTTHYVSAFFAPQINIHDAKIYLGGGVMNWFNKDQSLGWIFAELGFKAAFGLQRKSSNKK